MSAATRTGALLLAAALLAPARAAAQDAEPLWDRARRTFQQEALTVGALLQIVGDAQLERTMPGTSGFSVANARLRVEGRLDQGFEYLLQTAFTRSPALLDARVGYRISGALAVDAGLFKAPFSREFLTSAASIDFVNRAQAVTALVPGRQVGAQLRATAGGGRWEGRAGVFNGNGGTGAANDDERFLYVARAGWRPWGIGARRDGRPWEGEVAVSAAQSTDAAAPVNLLGGAFSGERRLLGADTRWRLGPTLLAAEVVAARLDPTGPAGAASPVGWHATLGRHVTPRSQLLLRWDALRGDGLVPDSDWLVLGWNRWPTSVTEIQVNWIVDLDRAEPEHHQLLVNLQVGF